jgi:hypothetical protein
MHGCRGYVEGIIMAKVNGLFQDAEEAKFDRYTNIIVEADVEMMFHCGKIEKFRISDISCLWIWDELTRDAAEYWSVWDHVGANYEFDWMSIKSWSGTPVNPVKEED